MKYLSQYTNSDVILVAYRGFSDSAGTPTEQGLKSDSYAVLRYAIEKRNQMGGGKPIYILGRSLGGAVTINLASNPTYSR